VANGDLTLMATLGGNIAHDRDFGSQRNIGEVVCASLTAGASIWWSFPVNAQGRQIPSTKAGRPQAHHRRQFPQF
jgi:hypothetical protein